MLTVDTMKEIAGKHTVWLLVDIIQHMWRIKLIIQKAKPQNMIRAWMKFDSLLRSKTISIYFYLVFVFIFLLYADLTY